MKFALVVNLSKERAIKYAKKISLFLLDIFWHYYDSGA